MRVPFVTFKPMEKELDKELRGAFERVVGIGIKQTSSTLMFVLVM